MTLAFKPLHDVSATAVPVGAHMLIFKSPRELDLLRRPGFVKGRAVLLLRFPGIAPERLQRWQRTLNSRFNACGCATGAAFGMGVFLATVVWQWSLGGWGIAHWGAFALRALAGVFLSGALGKAIGIQLARWDLRRVAHNIQRSMGLDEAGDL
jgi:hypothetical protein